MNRNIRHTPFPTTFARVARPSPWRLLLLFLPVLPLTGLAEPDTDGNGMGDAWEMFYFHKLGNDPKNDIDGDGASNFEESLTGTNPRNKYSYLRITEYGIIPQGAIVWGSTKGKDYQLECTLDLKFPWTPLHAPNPLIPVRADAEVTPDGALIPVPIERKPIVIQGTGSRLELDVRRPTRPLLRGAVTRELWLNTSSTGAIDVFKKDCLGWPDANSPTGTPVRPPDGVENLAKIQSPSNERDRYGQRIRGFILPPVAGEYTFHIAGRHQCEFWLSKIPDSSDPTDLVRQIRQTGQGILDPEDWDYYPKFGLNAQQTSKKVTLEAGRKYYFEAIHQHNGQEDHLAVAWSPPWMEPGTIRVIGGRYVMPMIDLENSNAADFAAILLRKCHYRVSIAEGSDQDEDGVDDYAEHLFPGWDPFQSSSAGGDNDLAAFLAALNADKDLVTVQTIDGRATEFPGETASGIPYYPDVGRFRITRTGSLRPLNVYYTLGGGDDLPREEESPESSDYLQRDINNNTLFGRVTLPAGARTAQVVIRPVRDEIMEYPETVSLQLEDNPDYQRNPAGERAELRLYDVRNTEANEILFVGFSQPQPGAASPRGSAISSGKLNADRSVLTLFSSITAGFSSPQVNSHVHKDEGTPGSDPVTFSLPPTGEISDLPWALSSNGSYRPQTMIDSLFNQQNESTTPGESRLYINWHTDLNPSGELYAFLAPAEGSVTPEPPPPPPEIAFIDPVTQEAELRQEIVRFLNQATFGAAPDEIESMYQMILTHPNQDRVAVFNNWIETQLDHAVTDQTRALDFTLASDFQGWYHRGYFTPSFFATTNWGSAGAPETRNPPRDPITALELPEFWPSMPDANPGFLDYTDPSSIPTPSHPYPVSQSFANSVDSGTELGLGQEQQRSNRHALWTMMLNAKDQLRQRLAFAWSQIFVISVNEGFIRQRYYGATRYWDMLAEGADDTFHDLLEGVSYSPMMGVYLSHLYNAREADLDGDGVVDVFPDENYAREIMQLFTIGLKQLHLDGTLALDPVNGLPQPTYDNDDITELARVFTGFGYSRYVTAANPWNDPTENNFFRRGAGASREGAASEYPMKMFGDEHDPDPKVIAGGIPIDNDDGVLAPSEIGHADLADVHDWLAGSGAAPYDGHPTTPPFIARRLIQRLVTSNPPSDYIHRVATVFVETGGDLKQVTKAVLLDYHARSPEVIDTSYGRKKPPLIAFMQLLRAMESASELTVTELTGSGATGFGLPPSQAANFIRDTRFRFGDTQGALTMTPMRAPTVFNWYLPDFAPGGVVANAGLVAPELQILNAVTAIQNINAFWSLTHGGSGYFGEFIPNYEHWGIERLAPYARLGYTPWTDEISAGVVAGIPEWEMDKAIVDQLDLLLCAGRLQSTFPLDPADRTPAPGQQVVDDPEQNPREAIIDALTLSFNPAATNHPLYKARLALYLMSVTPSFQVQR